ncbi:MAG TPA: hypothetical protein V6D43_19610 [Candidatus Sericytochromatia bacterium]|jgi:hypothetical protein
MNRICQLAQLILDFYREEPQQLRQLEPLRTCKVFRRWGVLYIRCHNQETAAALMKAGLAIAEPVARLRLAKKITLLSNNTSVAVFPVDFSKINA